MKYCPVCTSKLEARVVDGESRLACSAEDCAYVLWENPVPVVAGLVQLADHYLLARNTQWPKGSSL